MAISSRSAEKRARTSEKARIANKSRRAGLLTLEKSLREAVAASDTEKAKKLLGEVLSKIDKAGAVGTIHKNKRDRKKGQLTKLLAVKKTS